MPTPYTVSLTLTPLQAESLLQLAQEAEMDGLVSEDGIQSPRRQRAADAAMDRLIRAMALARRGVPC